MTFPTLKILRSLRPFLRPSRGCIALAALLGIVLIAVQVAAPLLVGCIVDALFPGPSRSTATLPLDRNTALSLLAVAVLLQFVFMTRQHWLAESIGARCAARLRDALWAHLQDLPLDYTRARGPQRLLPRFNTDARAVQLFVTHGLVQMPQALLLAVAILCAMAWLNYPLALISAAIVLVIAFVCGRSARRVREEERDLRRRGKKLNSFLEKRLLAMPLIKSFARQSIEEKNFHELNRNMSRQDAWHAFVAGRSRSWIFAGLAVAGVLALVFAADEIAAARITVGGLTAYLLLLGSLCPVLLRLSSAPGYFQDGKASLERVLRVLDQDSEKTAKAPALKVTEGEVLIRNLSCRLNKRTPLLAETNLRARRGALTAIIGPKGCGKTTLLELLLLFRRPASGEILIDGQDITGVSLKSLRSQVALISDDLPLLDGTIRDSIAYGLEPDVTREQLVRAAQLAGAEGMIAGLRKGWNTRVKNLSRSQRWHIALARALAVNPSIVLCDDPGLDLESDAEMTFIQTLRNLARHKTVLLAGRRIPSSLALDQMFTLGPVPELLRQRKKEKKKQRSAPAIEEESPASEAEVDEEERALPTI